MNATKISNFGLLNQTGEQTIIWSHEESHFFWKMLYQKSSWNTFYHLALLAYLIPNFWKPIFDQSILIIEKAWENLPHIFWLWVWKAMVPLYDMVWLMTQYHWIVTMIKSSLMGSWFRRIRVYWAVAAEIRFLPCLTSSCLRLFLNIAKGTTGPRVEFLSQNLN